MMANFVNFPGSPSVQIFGKHDCGRVCGGDFQMRLAFALVDGVKQIFIPSVVVVVA